MKKTFQTLSILTAAAVIATPILGTPEINIELLTDKSLIRNQFKCQADKTIKSLKDLIKSPKLLEEYALALYNPETVIASFASEIKKDYRADFVKEVIEIRSSNQLIKMHQASTRKKAEDCLVAPTSQEPISDHRRRLLTDIYYLHQTDRFERLIITKSGLQLRLAWRKLNRLANLKLKDQDETAAEASLAKRQIEANLELAKKHEINDKHLYSIAKEYEKFSDKDLGDYIIVLKRPSMQYYLRISVDSLTNGLAENVQKYLQ